MICIATHQKKPVSRLPFDRPLLPVFILVILVGGCGGGSSNRVNADEPAIGESTVKRSIGTAPASGEYFKTEEGTILESSMVVAFSEWYSRGLTDEEMIGFSEFFGRHEKSNGPVRRQQVSDNSGNIYDINYVEEERSTLPDKRRISAGEVLPITTPAGSWQELKPSGHSTASSLVNDEFAYAASCQS